MMEGIAMKQMLLLVVASFLFASPVQAVPLTWTFSGTTSMTLQSEYNGMPAQGLDFEFRIFLDTDAMVFVPSIPFNDVIFSGPFQGEIDLETFGLLPVHPVSSVENFAPSQGGVIGVEYTQPFPAGKSFINFPSIISSDRTHLTPIPPTAPLPLSSVRIGGPDNLILFAQVATFSATVSETTVPEGGSTAVLLAASLAVVGFLRRRYTT
jgi:hypothetical protein